MVDRMGERQQAERSVRMDPDISLHIADGAVSGYSTVIGILAKVPAIRSDAYQISPTSLVRKGRPRSRLRRSIPRMSRSVAHFRQILVDGRSDRDLSTDPRSSVDFAFALVAHLARDRLRSKSRPRT